MNDLRLGTAQILGEREEQQDSYGHTSQDDDAIATNGGIMAVVADGIGGHAHGGDASRRAVAAFLEHYQSGQLHDDLPNALYHALIQANHAVLDFAESQGEVENCGTTLIAMVMHHESRYLHWIGVGDSRLYLLRNGQLAQFTADANFADHIAKKVARGIASRNDLFAEENPHRLTSFLGLKKLGKIDRSIRPFPLHQGDVAMICTDGIYNALSKEELSDCLSEEPQTACDRIIQSILEKHHDHQDNATVAVLAFGLKDLNKHDLPKSKVSVAVPNATKSIDSVEPSEIKHPAKLRLLILGILALGLLILLGFLWLQHTQDVNRVEQKNVEETKPIEPELNIIKKPEQPPRKTNLKNKVK